MNVSLIICVYNREQYLAATIESILVQSYDDFELLIWDDGSTDRSVEIANQYTKFDKRVKVITAPHCGFAQSLKNAIGSTNGKYLGWVDSDDLLASTALEETVHILENQPTVGMVYTDHLVTDKQGKVQGLGYRCSIPYSAERLLIDFMTFHFRLIRREIYDRVGGIDIEMDSCEDYDLCLRLSEVTEIYHLQKPLYLYRIHEESICQTQPLKQILTSTQAINNALVRRGLSDRLELQINYRPQFILKPKSKKAISF